MDRRLLAQLVRRAGGHPQDTMTVAFCLYQLLYQEQRETARETDVARALSEALGLMAAAFEQLWLDFNSERGNRIVIARLARGVPLYGGVTDSERAAIDRAMKRLLADGYIQKLSRGSYRLTEPLLADYVSDYLDVRA